MNGNYDARELNSDGNYVPENSASGWVDAWTEFVEDKEVHFVVTLLQNSAEQTKGKRNWTRIFEDWVPVKGANMW